MPLFSWKQQPTIARLCSCHAAHAASACLGRQGLPPPLELGSSASNCDSELPGETRGPRVLRLRDCWLPPAAVTLHSAWGPHVLLQGSWLPSVLCPCSQATQDILAQEEYGTRPCQHPSVPCMAMGGPPGCVLTEVTLCSQTHVQLCQECTKTDRDLPASPRLQRRACSPARRVTRGGQPTQLPPCIPYIRLPPSSLPAPTSPGHLSGPQSICPAHPPSPSASSAWRQARPPAGRAATVTAGGHPSGPLHGRRALPTPSQAQLCPTASLLPHPTPSPSASQCPSLSHMPPAGRG